MKSLYKSRKSTENPMEIERYASYPDLRLLTKDEEGNPVEVQTEEEQQIDESLRQAEKIIDTARQEADVVIKKAYEEGYAKGESEGYEEGFRRATQESQKRYAEEISRVQEMIADYIKDVEIEKQKILEQYLDDLKDIALAIGEKIVQVSLKSSSDVVEKMILSATERLKKSAWAKIYIGQNGEKTDAWGDSQFIKELSKLSDNVKVVLMEETEPGTCIVELPDEVIDISVGTQLENIKEILNNARI